jgi:hypothetical protein
MTLALPIPGRRISKGEIFCTPWFVSRGECVLLRGESLYKGGAGTVDLSLETRGEDGTAINPITPTTTAISLSTAGVLSCLYLATATTNGAQMQVRVKMTYTGGAAGDYMVVRVFPPLFFASARPY